MKVQWIQSQKNWKKSTWMYGTCTMMQVIIWRGQPSKFREWDEGITGLVESGDHWVMKVIKDVVDMGSTTLGNISSSIMLSDHYVVI